MICPECLTDRPSEDFQRKDVCYKCTYKKKTGTMETVRHCYICNKHIPKRKIKYCSLECAAIADQMFWTRKIKSSPMK